MEETRNAEGNEDAGGGFGNPGPTARRRPGPRRPPLSAAEILRRLLRNFDAAPSGAVFALCDAWERVVGAPRAALVRPVSLENGVLWLVSSDYAAKSEVFLSREEVVRRANEVLGLPLVQTVRFRA